MLIGIGFIVSPIMVHNLGNEVYGIWTLIVSITGYFTVLDFGVNTAIVRFISMYFAKRDLPKANEVYSTSFVFFSGISVFIILITVIFGAFFGKIFGIKSLSNTYLYLVFAIVGIDLASSLICSVLLGTLAALQEFVKINIISITTHIAKNIVLVVMLLSGYKLLTLAIIQISFNLLRYLGNYIAIRRKYGFLHFRFAQFSRSALKQIFDYSIYSFLIAIAFKLLFYTDSIVIGSLISVSDVTFYAIPATILEYMEKFLWTVTAVLIPVISSNDAVGDKKRIERTYLDASKYSLMLCIPAVFVLYTKGPEFISIWIGEEYGVRATWVLRILLIGYVFYYPQMIAHGILKGISKHKVYAYVLIAEAVANLLLSILLVSSYGIEGVALGTTIPLIIVNTVVVPVYVCRVLGLNISRYIWASYSGPFFCFLILGILYSFFTIGVENYVDLAIYAFVVTLLVFIFSLIFIVEKSHRDWILSTLRRRLMIKSL